MNQEKFGLSVEQVEILYNIECQKTLNDIRNSIEPIKTLKKEWLAEWKLYMEKGFPQFVGSEDVKMNWYDRIELLNKIKDLNAKEVWYRLVLLETLIFEPYFALSTEKNQKGDEVPSKKYDELKKMFNKFDHYLGDMFLDNVFVINEEYNYISRLRDSYKKATKELNETLKKNLKTLAIMAGVSVTFVATAGILSGPIAVALVGSEFAGLSGAALTSACLAYLGGGAVAAGGAGMLGGTVAIVGGGAVLGGAVGAGAGAVISGISDIRKDTTIAQSAKLMVSIKEIFLNDEKDIIFSNSVYEEYVNNIRELEKKLVDLKLKENVVDAAEKDKMKAEIMNLEDSVHAMKIAMNSMNRFKSAFEIGLSEEQ